MAPPPTPLAEPMGSPAPAMPATTVTPQAAWAMAAAATPVVRYGGFWRRFWAAVLDALILQIVTVPMGLMMSVPTTAAIQSDNLTAEQLAAFLSAYMMAAFVGCLANWLYCALMESSKWQATLGKIALGMKVTDLEGRRIGFGRASGRFFAKIVSSLTLFIGYLIQVFTERRQALHDLIAGTVIVRREG
jgi:uncharacterized RDD family membrane protein YckC